MDKTTAMPLSRTTGEDQETFQSLLEGFDIRILLAAVDTLPIGAWDNPTLANSYWRLYQNDAPGGWLEQDRTMMLLEPGRVYLIPSGLTLASRNKGPLNQFFVHFDPVGVSPVFFQMLFPGPVPVPHSALYSQIVAELGQRVLQSGAHELGIQCSIKGVILDAFGRCLSTSPQDEIEKYWQRVSAMSPVLPAIHYVHDHLGSRITNTRLAAGCHLSEDHFIRRFRRAVGMTPARYIMKQRVNWAAQLLLFTDETIDHIAEKTGFGDRYYFSRVFARESGLPPALYRRTPRV